MGPLRFGILGCSNVARRRFLPSLRNASNARLERFGSRTPAKAAEYARLFDCAKTGTYEDVLRDPEVDAVYISTPATLHRIWIEQAARHGKHILCEKPAALNWETAAEMVRLCREQRVCLLEGYGFAYHPQHAFTRALIEQDRIGAPRFFEAEFTYPRPPAGDIRLRQDLAGGVFFDAGGYPFAALRAVLPWKPVSVYCHVNMDPAGGVDDWVSMMLHFAGGETAHLATGFGLSYRSKYAVLGVKGRVQVERAFAIAPDAKATVTLETDAGVESFSIDPADQFRLMIEDFASQCAKDGAGGLDFERNLLRQQALMDAAWRSSRESQSIRIEWPA
jgi:NDP-hexose-3-ketoreductase